MVVFYGSTMIVKQPLSHICRNNLDFGKGFYVTDLQEQAALWAKRVAATRNSEEVWLNIYELDLEAVKRDFRSMKFESYNGDWLEFILDARQGGTLWAEFDIVEGGIADDRVFNTIELYFDALISQEDALKRLSFEHPNNQLCIINQGIIDNFLVFKEAIPLHLSSQKGGIDVASK